MIELALGHLSIGTPGTGIQPPTTPLGLGPKHPSLMRLHSNSNGISFDSDKGEFKEFIDVGSQTNEGNDFPNRKASDPLILLLL
jgi:hypothetical protein